MAGLVPAIHVGPTPELKYRNLRRRPDVDPRDKPGDDEEGEGKPFFSKTFLEPIQQC